MKRPRSRPPRRAPANIKKAEADPDWYRRLPRKRRGKIRPERTKPHDPRIFFRMVPYAAIWPWKYEKR